MVTVCYNPSLLKVCYSDAAGGVCTGITPPCSYVMGDDCEHCVEGETPEKVLVTFSDVVINNTCYDGPGGSTLWQNVPDINKSYELTQDGTLPCKWTYSEVADADKIYYSSNDCSGSPITSFNFFQLDITLEIYPTDLIRVIAELQYSGGSLYMFHSIDNVRDSACVNASGDSSLTDLALPGTEGSFVSEDLVCE